MSHEYVRVWCIFVELFLFCEYMAKTSHVGHTIDIDGF